MTEQFLSSRRPLTAAQHGIWLGQSLVGKSSLYWTAECVELLGDLASAPLRAAIEHALSEARCLHVRFGYAASGAWHEPVAVQVPVGEFDFSHTEDPWQAALDFMQRDLRAEADLAVGPLFSTALLRLAPARHVWYLRVHHIAADGYAFSLIFKRVAEVFAALERGAACARREAPVLDVLLAEEAAYRASAAFTRDARFFNEPWQNAPQVARELPAKALGAEALRARAHIAAETVAQWQSAAAAERVELSAWLLAASFAWLT
ncbi:MAG TPA: condensation domain-containing protein, partial [Polyangiales bacterium]|nr:condensation domain-containing protein [Polyangiales bacterium]